MITVLMGLNVIMQHFDGTEITHFNGAMTINLQLNCLKNDQFNCMLF